MFSAIRRAPRRCEDCCSDPLPDPNLSISPREIEQLTLRGVAASSANAGLVFSDGVANPALLLENTRGVDPADLWTASKDAVEKLVRAHKKDKSEFS